MNVIIILVHYRWRFPIEPQVLKRSNKHNSENLMSAIDLLRGNLADPRLWDRAASKKFLARAIERLKFVNFKNEPCNFT